MQHAMVRPLSLELPVLPMSLAPVSPSISSTPSTAHSTQEDPEFPLSYKEAQETMFCSTPYKVATITANASVGTELDLDVLYACGKVFPEDHPEDCILYIEYGKDKFDAFFKGQKPTTSRKGSPRTPSANMRKKETTKVAKPRPKRFDNQMTLWVKVYDASSEVSFVNMKIFKNGVLQMTGIKEVDLGMRITKVLCDTIRGIAHYEDPRVCADIAKLSPENYTIQMINSVFSVNYQLSREQLSVLLQSHYKNDCYFESDGYPGVKLRYYWREEGTLHGNCPCGAHGLYCRGAKSPKGVKHTLVHTKCRKITVLIFQSGSIIITGAHTHAQIQETYNYICGVLQEHHAELCKRDMLPR